MDYYGNDADSLTFDMFQFFKQQPVKREDFGDLQLEYDIDTSLFLRHVPSRWLTLLPAMERVLKNWSVSVDYFTEQLPNSIKSKSQKKNLETNEKYRRICKNLTDRKVMVQVAFLMSVTPLFEKFLTIFQCKGPIVHVILDECSSLLRTVIGRFMKTDVVGDKTGRRLLEIDCKDAKKQLLDK